jgi:hypothetical protein
MTLNLILSLIKPTIVDNKPVAIKASKSIGILMGVHKTIHNLIKDKKILSTEDEEENEEYLSELVNNYKKKFKKLTKEENIKNKKSRIIVKFGLIILFLYLKHPDDFGEDVDDLIGIIEHNFDKEWMKVFTALCLNLLHKGSPLINDVVMNEYKKMSSYIGKDGFDVIVEYLKDTKIMKNKKKFEDESNEMNLEENEDI